MLEHSDSCNFTFFLAFVDITFHILDVKSGDFTAGRIGLKKDFVDGSKYESDDTSDDEGIEFKSDTGETVKSNSRLWLFGVN